MERKFNISEAQEALRHLNLAFCSAILANIEEKACYEVEDSIRHAENLIKRAMR